MSARKKLEEKIQKKNMEIDSLRKQIADAEIYVQALMDAIKVLPRENDGEVKFSAFRQGSDVYQVRELLKKERRPIHIDEILTLIGKEVTKENKVSLAGSLSAYVRKNDTFSKPEPNTFALIIMEDDKIESADSDDESADE